VLAVEERHDIEQSGGKESDLLGEAARVAESDDTLSFLLDRKCVEDPQPWPLGRPRITC
jgi:hypothetical protein